MTQEAVKEVKVGNKILRIFQDEYAESPRSWDNMGKLICFHKRYNLGDKHDYKHENYANWAEMKAAISRKEDVTIILPIYLYDHSGITISTSPFNCNWDSGQVGFAIITKETIRKEFSVKRVTKALIERATQILLNEVDTYDQYLRGEVYGFKVVNVSTCDHGDEHEEHEDSCYGFYGSNFKENGIIEHLDKELAEALKAA